MRVTRPPVTPGIMSRRIRSSRESRHAEGIERGQGLVEFALVLPILALFLLGILQLGVLLATQVGITNAVREAVRNASALPVATAADAQNSANLIYTRLTGSNGLLARNGSSYSTASLEISGSPRTRVCYYSYTDATGQPSIMANVEVVYKHRLFLPIISAILDGFDGSNDQAYRMVVGEEIRVSNGILASTDIGGVLSPTCRS
jgi:Flp pilus assembly protein TadG